MPAPPVDWTYTRRSHTAAHTCLASSQVYRGRPVQLCIGSFSRYIKSMINFGAILIFIDARPILFADMYQHVLCYKA